ncbi:MAG TPA: DinB family protein [Thermoanaerobaculia bacterium]|nr:DinB family protein [Thermoanaerobaculia bacterium]
MTEKLLRHLLLYTMWADRICLKALEAVRPEDLRRETGTSFGSLLGTLIHQLGGERLWLARCAGKALDRLLAVDEFADLEALTAAWGETSAELGFFLASLTGEQAESPITWTSTEGSVHTRPLWELLAHLVNHSTYHRGQAMSLLRQLGYVPPSTDLIYFLLDQATLA